MYQYKLRNDIAQFLTIFVTTFFLPFFIGQEKNEKEEERVRIQ